MTADPTTRPTASDRPDPVREAAARLAARARSILACHQGLSLVVDGHPEALSQDVDFQDAHGTPTFLCPPDADLARAAGERRSALLVLDSGLGPRGGPEREVTLTLAGRLEPGRPQACECCDITRAVVTLRIDAIVLAVPATATAPAQQLRVPVADFTARTHALNAGYLQRWLEHLNGPHAEQLRRTVATATGVPLSRLLGAGLSGLDAEGVDLNWVDPDGAHTAHLRFPRPARPPQELSALMRRELESGLC